MTIKIHLEDIGYEMDWKPVCAFADWIETQPIQGRVFAEWYDSFWPAYERRCHDVCKNVYVMYESVQAFDRRLGIGMTWDQAIGNPALKNDLDDICAHIQVRREEYFSEGAQTAFETRCREIFDARR